MNASRFSALAVASGLACCPAAGWAHDGTDAFAQDGTADGQRGRVSLVYQGIRGEGLILDSGTNNNGAITDTHALKVAVDYRVSDRWELHAAIPFIRKRSHRDPGSHDPLALDTPHPESQFLDDGDYHGTWQDWQLGLTHHRTWKGFDVETHAILTIPSHDYTFFANAAVGQRLHRLKLGFDASRRIGTSNYSYRVGYSYEFFERVLDTNLDKQHLRLSVDRFFSPSFTGRVFVDGRYGNGRDTGFFPPSSHRSENWYQHDRLSKHNYVLAGAGASWRINDEYSMSASVGRMVWGRTVHEVKYAWEIGMSRGF